MNCRIYFIVLFVLPLSIKAQSPFKGFERLFTTPKNYIVNYVKVPPFIDGDINDAVWQQAQWTNNFTDIEGDLKPAPKLQTNVKMLWGDSCIYIAAKIMDPNIWATLKQHDQLLYYENNFEVFFDINNTTHQYFELEFSPLNTVFDLFLSKAYRNGGKGMIGWNAEGLRSAVKIQGTLNSAADVDQGWTIEIAVPYKAISIGNDIQTPVNKTIWRVNFMRTEWDTKIVNGGYTKLTDNKGTALPANSWVWSPQGITSIHYPERWGYVQFNKETESTATFTVPYTELQKQYLWLIYYKEKKWFSEHGAYGTDLKLFDLAPSIVVNNHTNTLQLEATAHQFMAFIRDENEHITWCINQEGLISQLNKKADE